MMHEAQEHTEGQGHVEKLKALKGGLKSTEADTSARIARSIELIQELEGSSNMIVQALNDRAGLREILKRARDSSENFY